MFRNPSDEERRKLLQEIHNIAVVGLSPNEARPSNRVARALQRFGYKVIPVRPLVAEVLGERAYASLSEVPVKIDLVGVFRAPQHIDAIVDECIRLGIKRLWIQLGIVNEPAALRAQQAGITVVMDRCIKIDYTQLMHE
ncbi:MAG: CoA-binding protein [Pseudomonadota bacterium]